MRFIRALILAVALATWALLGTATPAQALTCHEGQSCDCSIRVLGKTIIPCNQ